MTEMRFRKPTRNATCTAPHSHQAIAPLIRTKPKSATADLRPMVARLPKCWYRKADGSFRPDTLARMTLATYSPPCFAAGASPGTEFPFHAFDNAVSPIAKTLGNPAMERSGPTL